MLWCGGWKKIQDLGVAKNHWLYPVLMKESDAFKMLDHQCLIAKCDSVSNKMEIGGKKYNNNKLRTYKRKIKIC